MTASRIIHEHPADRPANAALNPSASIALTRGYSLRIPISLTINDD